MKLKQIVFILALFSLSSCSALKEAEKEIDRQKVIIEELEKAQEYEPDRMAADTQLDAIKHIVFFKLRKPEDRVSFKTLFYNLKELEGIEYVNNFALHKKIDEVYSPLVRTDYDIVMYMTFASEKHLVLYQNSEIHNKVKDSNMELIEEVWSYDFKTL